MSVITLLLHDVSAEQCTPLVLAMLRVNKLTQSTLTT